MVPVTCEEIREDLEAYALDALEPAEALRVAAHVDDCDDCRELLAGYRDAVEYLAFTAPLYHASPRLKERILGGIGASRPALAAQAVLRRPWLLSAAAVVLIGLAIGGLAWAITLSSQVERLRTDNARLAELTQLDSEQRAALLRLQGDLTSAKSEQQRISTTLEEQAKLILVALDPELIPSELRGTNLAPSARCNYVWSSQQAVGALTCKDVPFTAFGLTYELWATRGDKTVAVATFQPRNDGTASVLVKFPANTEGPVNNMWVTLEQNSTHTRPSSEVVMQRVPNQQAAR
jgi:hypothetical protein